MREILFRGRRIDNDNEEWVEGGIIDCKQRGLFIAVHHPDYADAMDAHRYGSSYSVPVEVTRFFKIDPSTLCQFTGLHDKNGVRIWEGDRIIWRLGRFWWKAIVSAINDTQPLYFIETTHNVTEEDGVYTYKESDSRKGSRNELIHGKRDIEVIGSIHDKEQS